MPKDQKEIFNSYWRNGLLLLIVVTPFVAFKFDYLSKDWLNRLGIILNFLAGFMVAPDLIGVEKLIKFEDYLEGKFDVLGMRFGVFSNRAIAINVDVHKNDWSNKFRWYLPYLLFSFVVYFLFYKYRYFKIFLLVYSICFLTFLLYVTISNFNFYFSLRDKDRSVLYHLWQELIYFIQRFFFVYLYALYMPLVLIIIIPIRVLIDEITKSLRGDKRLIAILIWWGVVFFIMGNLMQFVASFDYDKRVTPPTTNKKVAPAPSSYTSTNYANTGCCLS